MSVQEASIYQVTEEQLKRIVSEAVAESDKNHHCRLSSDDMATIKTVSSFLTRCRNALGNFFMVLIAVVALMGIGGVLYLMSGGHINLFKVFGIGG